MAARKDSVRDGDQCAVCNVKYTGKKDKLLSCDRCDSNFCIACLGISTTEHKILKKPEVLWFCKDCQQPAIKAVKTDREIEERCEEYFEKMTKRLDALTKKINTKADKTQVEAVESSLHIVTDKVNDLENKVSNLDIDKINGHVETLVNRHLEDSREKERRKNNIIVYNVEESEEADPTTRVAEDSNKIKSFFKKDLKIVDTKVHKIFRVGKKTDTAENTNEASQTDGATNGTGGLGKKPRPIKVQFQDQGNKTKVMKSYWDLKKEGKKAEYPLSNDFSKAERDAHTKLKAELKQRLENNPDEQLVIRRGKIVKKR